MKAWHSLHSFQESLDTKTQCTVPAFVERLVVWDAVFFVRIAECGYPFEQFHAFFPALPSFMWILKETGLCASLMCNGPSTRTA